MGFFDNLKSSLTETGQDLSQKAKDTTEIFVRYNNPYKYKNILINKLTNIESPFKPFPDNDTIGWSITKDINTSFRDDGLSKKFVLDLYSKIKDYLCS